MIKSKKDYLYYLNCDKTALGKDTTHPVKLVFDEIYQFERLLRKTEYFNNCRKDFAGKFYLAILRFRLRKKQLRLGFTIPLNVFGPGLSIAHYGTLVVSSLAQIGANCRIHVGVNIGAGAVRGSKAPVIGDNVYIGPGAKLFGDIVIGSGSVIGANAVVNKSFPDGNQTIAGVPARVISDKNSELLLVRAAD